MDLITNMVIVIKIIDLHNNLFSIYNSLYHKYNELRNKQII